MATTAAVIVSTQRVDIGPHESNSLEMDAVLSRCLPSLHRRAFRYLGNAADAEDAVQDALLSAYRHLETFRGQAQTSTWLTTIVTNAALKQLRKRIRRGHVPLDDQPSEGKRYPLGERLPDRGPNPEDVCRGVELAENLTQSNLQLSPALRSVFHLRFMEACSIREIAHTLGVTEGTVKARICRARAKLISLMQKRLGEVQHCNAKSSMALSSLPRSFGKR